MNKTQSADLEAALGAGPHLLHMKEEPSFQDWLALPAVEVYTRRFSVQFGHDFSYEANVRGPVKREADGSETVDYTRAIHHVRFMGALYEGQEGQDFATAKRGAIGKMADAFNRGVREGWLCDGVLAPCHTIPCSRREHDAPGFMREIATVYVGSSKTTEELNELYGAHVFVREGELPFRW